MASSIAVVLLEWYWGTVYHGSTLSSPIVVVALVGCLAFWFCNVAGHISIDHFFVAIFSRSRTNGVKIEDRERDAVPTYVRMVL